MYIYFASRQYASVHNAEQDANDKAQFTQIVACIISWLLMILKSV